MFLKKIANKHHVCMQFVCSVKKRMYDAVMIIMEKRHHPLPHLLLLYFPYFLFIPYTFMIHSNEAPLRGLHQNMMYVNFLFHLLNHHPPYLVGCTFLQPLFFHICSFFFIFLLFYDSFMFLLGSEEGLVGGWFGMR